ncbi:MAG: hypothetical protein ACXABO_00280 [Promethearchaeota archaeon]|jgi:hypothetical protein
MSIEKWLSKKGSKKEEIKREEAFNKLSKEEIKLLKKKKIQNLVKQDNKKSIELIENESFLSEILEFKKWLNQRTFLKGDIDKIETRIKNLYLRLKSNTDNEGRISNNLSKKDLQDEYKQIPLTFLDEKTRVAINKKFHGTKRTNSDNYYLRKLRNIIKEKLNEANYYKILDKVLKS